MTTTQATAEIFWTAFRALKRKEREAVVQKLMRDERTLEDLRYAMIIEDRRNEPTITLRDYLAKSEKRNADGVCRRTEEVRGKELDRLSEKRTIRLLNT